MTYVFGWNLIKKLLPPTTGDHQNCHCGSPKAGDTFRCKEMYLPKFFGELRPGCIKTGSKIEPKNAPGVIGIKSYLYRFSF